MRALALALVCAVAVTLAAPSPMAVAASDSCPAPERPVSGIPVALVHGWSSSAAAMTRTADALGRLLGPGYTMLRFDYSAHAQEWPARDSARCLASYLLAAWEAGGRRHRVAVVTHSMGGLAARFAAARLSDSGQAAVLGTLVTLGTPHQGSPWGDTAMAALLERRLPYAFPPGGSSAGMCLAPLDRRPPDCATPPYLPPGVRIDQIGTQITIKRTLFDLGFIKHDAEISLWGDGIVPQDSAAGYVSSSPPASVPQAPTTVRTISCQYSTDYLMSLRFGAQLAGRAVAGGAAIGGGLATLGNILLDSEALDALNERRATPALIELTAYAARTPCFHTPLFQSLSPLTGPALPTEPRVLAAAADAVRRAQDGGSATRRVTLRPVDRDGRAQRGWAVQDGNLPVDCGSASPAATNDGIHGCGPTAAGADVCWPERDGASVLCLFDPWERIVHRHAATGVDRAVAAPAEASPIGLELADGARCRLRNGGSWPGRAEDENLYGAYLCTGPEDPIVWARRGSPEIDRSRPVWSVLKGTSTGQLRPVAVTTAFFAGTA